MTYIEVLGLEKSYQSKQGQQKVHALRGIDFTVEKGEFLAIMGESGSGKTTLLNLIALLDQADQGQVLLDGLDLMTLADDQLASFRRKNLGFVFQDYSLLDNFNVKDNILLPLVLSQEKVSLMEQKLDAVSKSLSIQALLDKYPYELSGGEKQRVAVARALITEPKLLLADEPTGALDSASSDRLLELFSQVNQEGQTILMVTHSIKAAAYASRVLFIRDGKIFHQIYKGDKSFNLMFTDISNTLALLSRVD